MGQIPNNFGILLGTGCDRFKTGSGQIWDKNRFGTDSRTSFRFFLGQVWDKFGTGLRQEHVWYRFQKILGFCLGQVVTSSRQVQDRFGTRIGLEETPDKFWVFLGTSSGQVWDKFGISLGQEQVWNRFQTSLGFFLGQVWDRFGKGLGQVWDKNMFGTDSSQVWGFAWDRLGQVWDRFGTRTGLEQIPDKFGIFLGTSLGQV